MRGGFELDLLSRWAGHQYWLYGDAGSALSEAPCSSKRCWPKKFRGGVPLTNMRLIRYNGAPTVGPMIIEE